MEELKESFKEGPSSGSQLSRVMPGSIRLNALHTTPMRRTGMKMEKVLFNKAELTLPELLIEDINVFLEIVTPSLWKLSLTEPQRLQLMKLLPTFEENDLQEKKETLRMLFSKQNFKFGNPLKSFHRKLRDGLFHPDIAKYAALCRKAKLKEYHHQQQAYYAGLLKEVLVNRQRILEQVYQTPPDRPLRFNHFQWRPTSSQDRSIEHRVKAEVSAILKEVNEECGAPASSDEESYSEVNAQDSEPESSQTVSSVQSTIDMMPFMSSSRKLPSRYKRRTPQDFTDQDLKHMLSRHKKRKKEYPDHPEMIPKNVIMEDILTRCHVGKKAYKSLLFAAAQKKRAKLRQIEMKKNPTPSEPAVPLQKLTVMAAPDEDDDDLDEMVDLDTVHNLDAEVKIEPGTSHNFFSLLKAFICSESDIKISTVKLEEKISRWQESIDAKSNAWFNHLPDWLSVLSSALKFLSGDVLTFKLDNFIPLLDYKERIQMWKWIAQGRDTDSELSVLYEFWRSNPITQGEGMRGGDRSSTPPPPINRTDYIVRPSSMAEKKAYHIQEEQHFLNPHRPFTFDLNGYRSVVGPVKGVFDKDSSSSTKARDHALLIKDRPAFVTILTLVRNAAARLPNGEGTRADVCEMLKDSQYLAEGVSDAQINTVVSGALDRLHYEKDPCVKYDVNRKLWIYLHRNRTEEDFEKIHEVDKAAAKAKKALSKSKASKKPRDSSPAISRQTSVLSSGSSESLVNVETLSPPQPMGMSPRQATPASPRGIASTPPIVRAVKPPVKTTAMVVPAQSKSLLQTAPPRMTTVIRPPIQQVPAVSLAQTPQSAQRLTVPQQKSSSGRGTTVRQQLMAVTAKQTEAIQAKAAIDASTPIVHLTTKGSDGKPGTVSGSQLRTQFLTSSGKPAAFAASPIIIGGKQAIIGGKPLQLAGGVQLIGNPRQLISGLPAGVTALNVVTQGSSVAVTTTLTTSTASTPSADNKVTQPLQILQPVAGKVIPAGAKISGAQTVQIPGTTSTATARVLTQKSGGGLVVTQIPQGQVTARAGTAAPGVVTAKTLSISQANLLAAGQPILVQQPGGQPKVVSSQQLLQGAALRPGTLTGAQKSSNLQLVKTVLSSHDKSPQATILLTQPQAGMQLSQGKAPAVTTVQAKSKGGPVYARIITPPPGLRLTAVRPNQVTQVMSPVQMSQMPQGVSMIQALGRLPTEAGSSAASAPTPTSSASDAEKTA